MEGIVPGALPPFPGAVIGRRRNGTPIRLIAGGDENNDLIGQLERRRSALVTGSRELLSTAAAENNGAGRDLTADEEQRYQVQRTEIRSLGERIDDLRQEDEREQRAAAARADGTTTTVDNGRGASPSGVVVTREPQTYERYSAHSYFADLLRFQMRTGDGDGGLSGAEERLNRHRSEMDVEMPRRREERTRAAGRMLEQRTAEGLAALPARLRRREERAVERFLGYGVPTFERRADSQATGAGGYFIPPLWLVDDWVPYLRAGRVLANLMASMPLPPGTNSINLPIIKTGGAVGPQAADGDPVGGRDLADDYVNALVRTVAGQQDASMQLLDLSPVAIDQIIFKDLVADHAAQVDGQVMLGSGTAGQMKGLFPNGVISGDTAAGVSVSAVGAAWTGAADRSDFYSSAGKLFSQIGRKRLKRVADVVSNEAPWNSFATSVDGNGRPLVPPSSPMNAAGVFGESGSQVEGPVGSILGRGWSVDNNVLLTFGGTTAPSMGALSAGHVSPVDGNGLYTPLIAGVFDDLYLFEGEVRTRVLQEVLSGTLQVRFQLYNYMTFMPDRYQDDDGNLISYGNVNSVGTAAGALSGDTDGGLVGY